MLTGTDEERSIHAYSLQHVLSLVSGQFIVEPRLSNMAVLLGHRLPQDLLKCRAFEWVFLYERREGGGKDRGGRRGKRRGRRMNKYR